MLANCGYKNSLFIPNVNVDYNKLHLTTESIYSITPYKWSKITCDYIKKYFETNKKICILDATSCVGGDTLCFSEYFNHVYCLEKDLFTYNCLKNNIKVYEKNNITPYNIDFLDFENNVLDTENKINKELNVVYFDPEWGGSTYRDTEKLSLFLSNVNIVDKVNKIFTNFSLYPNVEIVLLKIPKNYKYEDLQKYNTTKKFYKKEFPKFNILSFNVFNYRKIKYINKHTDTQLLYRLKDMYTEGDKNIMISVIKKHIKKEDVNIIKDWFENELMQNNNDITILINMRKFVRNYDSKPASNRVDTRVNHIKSILKNQISFNEHKKDSKFTYLDFGCGDADITVGIKNFLKIKAYQTIAADKIKWIDNENIKQHDITKLILEDNYEKIELKNTSINMITCFQSLHHIENIDLVLKEFSRITKENGYLIIREHDSDCMFTKYLIDFEHYIFEISLKDDNYDKCLEFYKNYKAYYRSRFDWTQLMYKHGFKYCKNIEYPEIKSQKNPTHYYYAAYQKMIN